MTLRLLASAFLLLLRYIHFAAAGMLLMAMNDEEMAWIADEMEKPEVIAWATGVNERLDQAGYAKPN
jgi:hypothetical protein